MGFTLKIEGNESLFYGENIVQMVTASLDTPKEGRTISIIAGRRCKYNFKIIRNDD